MHEELQDPLKIRGATVVDVMVALAALALGPIIGSDVGQMSPVRVPVWLQPYSQWVAHVLLVFGAALLALVTWPGLIGRPMARSSAQRVGPLGPVLLAIGLVIQLFMAAIGGLSRSLVTWPAPLASVPLALQVTGSVAIALSLGALAPSPGLMTDDAERRRSPH